MCGTISPVKIAIDQLNGNLGQFQLNPGQLNSYCLDTFHCLDLLGNNPFYGLNGNLWGGHDIAGIYIYMHTCTLRLLKLMKINHQTFMS